MIIISYYFIILETKTAQLFSTKLVVILLRLQNKILKRIIYIILKSITTNLNFQISDSEMYVF